MINHKSLVIGLKKLNLKIDDKGLMTYDCHPHHAAFFIILITTIMLLVLKKLNDIVIVPITLYSTTYYATFVEQMLILNKIQYYKLFKPYVTDIGYYVANKKKIITVNPKLHHFDDTVITLLPLTDEELDHLNDHTGLSNLLEAQNKVLSLLPDINAHYVVQQQYVDVDDYQYQYDDVVVIKKINDHLFRIDTTSGCFYTNMIITDYIQPLDVGDVLCKSYYHRTHDTIVHDAKYIVNQQRMVEPLRKKLLDHDIVTMPFYSLEQPRNSIAMHPFHLPPTK